MIFLSLKYSIFLTLSITGIFISFGYIFSYIKKRIAIYLYSTFGSRGILFTGVIGTAIHEIGHLIMCLIFRHKVIKFQLFNFKGYKYEETLGYVSHRYNQNSLYQKAGNFFIGVGPIIFGTLFIIISFKLLLPDKFESLNINSFYLYGVNVTFQNLASLLLNLFKVLFLALFSIDNFNNIKFYIFIYLIICVSTHISLSKKDFQNSYIGILYLFFIIFIICLLSIMLKFNHINILMIISNILLYLFLFLSIGLVFSIISLLITYILYLVK